MPITYSCQLGNVGVYQLLIGKDVKKVLCVVLNNPWINPDNLRVFRVDTKTFCNMFRIPATEQELENDDFEFIWRVTKETKSYDELMTR